MRLLLDSGRGIDPRTTGVKRRGWRGCGPPEARDKEEGPTTGVKVMKERSQSGSVVEAYVWPNLEPYQQLSYLEGCHPHIPRGLIHGVCGTAKEMGHRVVGGPAIRAGGAIDPSYTVVAAVGSIGRGGHKNLVGCLTPDDLLSSGGLLGGVWLWNKRPLQAGHHDRRLVQVWWWIAVDLTKDF